jgi:transcriptional regulator with XRE-family HTH domain
MQVTHDAGDGLEPSIAELSHAGPHLLRAVLGARLRQLREGQQIGRRQAADAIRGSESKISRLELGRIGYKVRDVADLLTLYGMTAKAERETLLALARQASKPPWWQPYRDVVPPWFESYLSLEQDAQVIRCYEPCHLPGLLQTPDYARAVIRQGHPGARETDIERRVSLRLRRQHLVTRGQPTPQQLWVVLDEAALRRPAGSLATMRAQLRHLIDMASQPHVRIFVVPFSVGQPGAVGAPFTILRFPGELIPDLVYAEQLTGASYVEAPDEVRYYWHLMNGLATEALDPDETTQFVERLLGEI